MKAFKGHFCGNHRLNRRFIPFSFDLLLFFNSQTIPTPASDVEPRSSGSNLL